MRLMIAIAINLLPLQGVLAASFPVAQPGDSIAPNIVSFVNLPTGRTTVPVGFGLYIEGADVPGSDVLGIVESKRIDATTAQELASIYSLQIVVENLTPTLRFRAPTYDHVKTKRAATNQFIPVLPGSHDIRGINKLATSWRVYFVGSNANNYLEFSLSNGWLTKSVSNGLATIYDTSSGVLQTITDPLGNTTTFTWDLLNTKLSIANSGRTYNYNFQTGAGTTGKRLATIDVEGISKIYFSYYDNPNGTTALACASQLSNLTMVASNETMKFNYDSCVAKNSDLIVTSVQPSIDPQIRFEYPSGRVGYADYKSFKSYNYDLTSTPKRITKIAENETTVTLTYDPNILIRPHLPKQVSSTVGTLTVVSGYTYNTLGQTLTVTRGGKLIASQGYDVVGRIKTSSSPGVTGPKLVYTDGTGGVNDLLKTSTVNRTVTAYEYTPLTNFVSTIKTNGVITASYFYDPALPFSAKGLPTKLFEPGATTTFEYETNSLLNGFLGAPKKTTYPNGDTWQRTISNEAAADGSKMLVSTETHTFLSGDSTQSETTRLPDSHSLPFTWTTSAGENISVQNQTNSLIQTLTTGAGNVFSSISSTTAPNTLQVTNSVNISSGTGQSGSNSLNLGRPPMTVTWR